MNKSELLKWLQEEYRQWEAFLDQIGPARMDQPGVNGDWSMKDIVAHLTGWQRRVVARLQAAQRSEPEPPPPWPAHLEAEDDINAWIYESNRDRSVREVLSDTQHVFQQLLAVIEGLPDDVRVEHIEPAFYLVWLDGQRFLTGEFFDHFHDDHEPDIRARYSPFNLSFVFALCERKNERQIKWGVPCCRRQSCTSTDDRVSRVNETSGRMAACPRHAVSSDLTRLRFGGAGGLPVPGTGSEAVLAPFRPERIAQPGQS